MVPWRQWVWEVGSEGEEEDEEVVVHVVVPFVVNVVVAAS
jgi:hypothetical protein